MCGYIETHFLENNKTSLDQFFRRWLIENNGSDDVHLTIEFTEFDLKCDLVDIILNPIHIPNAKNLVLETDLNYHISLNKSRQSKPLVSVCSMKPSAFVNLSGICESVLYGIPRVVKATGCWKIDWEELEKNQIYFKWLNSHMVEKGQALVLETKEIGPIHSTFLLLPSNEKQGTMLIKSVAVGDLMMPSPTVQCPSESDDVNNQEIKEKVAQAIDAIRVLTDYNPFDYTCNLFKTSTVKDSNGHNSSKKMKPNQQEPGLPRRLMNSGKSPMKLNFTTDYNAFQPSKSTLAWKAHNPRQEQCSTSNLSVGLPSRKKKPRFEPPKICK